MSILSNARRRLIDGGLLKRDGSLLDYAPQERYGTLRLPGYGRPQCEEGYEWDPDTKACIKVANVPGPPVMPNQEVLEYRSCLLYTSPSPRD